MTAQKEEILHHTATIVAAYVSRNQIPMGDLPGLTNTVFQALSGLDQPQKPAAEPIQPAVPIRKSVTPEYIVCLEDGKKLKMLKRHLRSTYNMTPDEYRAKWGLPAD